MARKLASIQRVLAIEPIPNADAIECVSILGWKVVCKKNEVQLNDLVVYFEIDSVLPDKPEFEFLKARGMRIRTLRLRGQVSQGLCLPLSILPADYAVEEGADCSEALGVTKYEPVLPASLSGVMKGKFPSFIPKTDETRIQVLQEVLDKYKGELCYVAEKLDGSSVTYFVYEGEFGVCSRNYELLEDEKNSFWRLARQLDIENKLKSLGGNYALQGELVGEGVQGNKLKIKGQQVYFFNIFDINAYQYLSYEKFIATLKQLDLVAVPILETNYALNNDIADLVQKATIKSTLCPTAWAEGIVIRPMTEKRDATLPDGMGSRVSFKAINPEFLLKYEE